jgi:lipoic acid synthetase
MSNHDQDQASGAGKPAARVAGVKERGELKTARIPIKIVPQAPQRKPDWIRVKAGNATGRFGEIKKMLREQKLHTVCEEAACPNIGECFGRGTATFMILGDICTRRCPFCDVGHGKPLPPDVDEPAHLADSVARLQAALRGDHQRRPRRPARRRRAAFRRGHRAVRRSSPGRPSKPWFPIFAAVWRSPSRCSASRLPDVLNHNLETVPRLYRQARPGADYAHSLAFMKGFKARYPQVPTKSGLMVGLGETDDEILDVLHDLRANAVEMLTIGQYLAPSSHHLPVARYVHPEVFKMYEQAALAMGFTGAACGPMVRSSYWADVQAHSAGVA